MHRLLQELRQDHVNLCRVLRLLESQIDALRGGGQANFHMLGEIVDYVRNYPDLIHHPREDMIFLVYLKRFPDNRFLIERLMEEHRTLIARTTAIGSAMEQWRCELPVPREHMARLFTEYLCMQWDHVNLEEQQVYRLLDEGLGAEDWEHIEAVMPRGPDPLFGELMRRRYENIYDQVTAVRT
jgi:hemerythrin-like domain-containing protein